MLTSLLLAESESPATWVAVGSAAVTTLGTIALALFAWLGNKDRERLSTVEAKVEDCEKHRQECEESREQTKAELTATRKELRDRDEWDKAELKAEIAALRAQVNGHPEPK